MKSSAKLLLCLAIVSGLVSVVGCGSRADSGDVVAGPLEIEAYLQRNPSPVEDSYVVE